jgi:hypothetical protein
MTFENLLLDNKDHYEEKICIKFSTFFSFNKRMFTLITLKNHDLYDTMKEAFFSALFGRIERSPLKYLRELFSRYKVGRHFEA